MGCGLLSDWLRKKGCIFDIGINTKAHASFSVKSYELETKTVYQFHKCYEHGYTCIENCTKRQKLRYKGMANR